MDNDDSRLTEIETSARVSTLICDGTSSQANVGGDDGENKELTDITEIDVCPICFQIWTSAGHHQMCCLPCGHIYGFSCIKKWLKRSSGSGKCPKCNKKCTMKGVRVLYATRLCVDDDELHKIEKAKAVELEDVKQLLMETQAAMKHLQTNIEPRIQRLEQSQEAFYTAYKTNMERVDNQFALIPPSRPSST